MKRNFSLLALLFLFLVNAQTYSFDFLTKYVSKYNAPEKSSTKEKLTYFNTDDFSYHLQVWKNENNLYGNLYDYSRKQIHKFDITEEKRDGEIYYSFQYTGTRKLINPHGNLEKKHLEFVENGADSVTVKIFKNSRAKNPEREYALKLKKANKNLFPIARIVFMHPYEDLSALNLNRNVMVDKATDICIEKNCNCEVSLSEYRNVELDLELPKTLKPVLF